MLPKYVKRVRSKGKDYYYFDTGKRVDGKKVYARLPDIRDPGFGGSLAAMQGHRNRRPAAVAMRVPELVALYQRSQKFKEKAAGTKRIYAIYLAKLERLLPTAPVKEITRGDMRRLFDTMGDTPGAANGFLRSASAMFAWALGGEYTTINPCEGIDLNKGGEHQPWPAHILQAALTADDERVRLLTHLLYYTAQRIGDVTMMGWGDIRDERVSVVQAKTSKKLRIFLHRDLQVELARHKHRSPIICLDLSGKPLTAGYAGKLLSDFTEKQGYRCVPHGLRKNAVIKLMEVGCSIGEIAAVSGQTLQVIEHYAKGRDQVALGDAAILRWQGKES